MTARLVFGESLSPDEILAVQHASGDLCHCIRWARREPGYQAHDNAPEVCAACRFRGPCAWRRDDKAAQQQAMDAAQEVIRKECVSGERRCSDFLFGCVHGPTPAELAEAFAEDG